MANILLIDQDKAARNLIQSLLGQQHNVVAAFDGPTAIQYCAMIQPDLILLNLTLPDIAGIELSARLKMFMPQTPILAIADTFEVSKQVTDEGMNILIKPLEETAFRTKVDQLLPPVGQPASPYSQHADQVTQQFGQQITALNQANQRLASLNAISALIGTSLDLEHLTDEILAQVEKTVAFDSATLFLVKGDILEAAASRGFFEYQKGLNTYSRNEHNSAWRVVNHKLPMIIADVSQSIFWEARPELERVRSWLGVPLIYKDRVVGVLTLDKHEPNAFSDVDARYLFTLAYQIAIAVENAQLFQEWEKQATRLKLINEITQEINGLLKRDDLFEALAKILFERLQYDFVAIFTREDDQTDFWLQASYGVDMTSTQSTRPSITAMIIGDAAETGSVVRIDDLQQYQAAWSDTFPPQTHLLAPVVLKGSAKAIIVIGQDYPFQFKDQDLWTLSSIASQTAVVLENARLYREVQNYSGRLERTIEARTQRLRGIKQINQAVSQGLDVDDLLTIVGRGVKQIFSGDDTQNIEVVIGLLTGASLLLTTIADDPLQTHHLAQNKMAVANVKLHEAMGYVLKRSKPLIDNQSSTHPGLNVMMAPLITGGKTIGLIQIARAVPHRFDDNDLETLESLTFQIASAVEQIELLQKTREIAIAEERTRLASDMHDGVAQNLAYLRLQVDRCLGLVEEEGKLALILEKISDLLAQNIDELRRNIFDLRPVELEGKSLFGTLEEFVKQFGKRWGINTECRIDDLSFQQDDTIVLPEIESSLYRILQETLSNARQHANATHLMVSVTLEDKHWLVLDISDDGCGFDVLQGGRLSGETRHRGLGLASMRQRAERLGGELIVESTIGQGTRVVARLPLSINISDEMMRTGK